MHIDSLFSSLVHLSATCINAPGFVYKLYPYCKWGFHMLFFFNSIIWISHTWVASLLLKELCYFQMFTPFSLFFSSIFLTFASEHFLSNHPSVFVEDWFQHPPQKPKSADAPVLFVKQHSICIDPTQSSPTLFISRLLLLPNIVHMPRE